MPFRVPTAGSEMHPLLPTDPSRAATHHPEPARRAVVAASARPSGDEFELSPQAVRRLGSPPASAAVADEATDASAEPSADEPQAAKRAPGGRVLSDDEAREVEELRKTDRDVRSHEQAHKATAGELAVGGPHYAYERGPDGRDYAVSGELQIQVREGQTPDETIRLAQKARRAALAAAEPSTQDRAVAAEASRLEQQARAELRRAREAGDEASGSDEDVFPSDALATPEPVEPSSPYGDLLSGKLDTSQLELYG